MNFTRIKYSVSAVIILACSFIGSALGADFKAGNIVVTDPWVRAMVPAAKVGSGYFGLHNSGNTADRLVAVRSDVSDRIEIHEMRMENNVMQMRRLEDGLKIPALETVNLRPGGYHIMFFDPKASFREGESFKANLEFEKAGQVEVVFKVRSLKGNAIIGHSRQGHQKY